MTKKPDPQVLNHLVWMGYVKPTGLVVSAPALVTAGAILPLRDSEGQEALRQVATEGRVHDFQAFAREVLGWKFSPKFFAGTSDQPIPDDLAVPFGDSGEWLRPHFAVREPTPKEGASPWQLLVRVEPLGADLDKVVGRTGQLDASPHTRMERLLRGTGVSAGLVFNGDVVRLISAPKGESSGWLDFRVADMVETAGRPILAAMRLLLGQNRLVALRQGERLAALLEDSRKFQNNVTERLAEQVLHALYELLRGFQAAHDASKGTLLERPLKENPDDVYRALLTTVLRLVFVLYAEERDLLPETDTFLSGYSLAGLYERLQEDAALYPDTMDQRFGAWAQLLALFRMVHEGAEGIDMCLPARRGVLFDPDRYPFLEGRTGDGPAEPIAPPLVPDGTLYRALEKLLVLDGERLSYRALDVEQIGSVYETMMGFRIETATGPSATVKAAKRHGAPTTVDLEALFQEPPAKRDKWFQDRTSRTLTDRVKTGVVAARSVQDLHAALLPILDLAAAPDLVPAGAMVLQPSDERRRSGSHYTPRSLTEPIVRTTLRPVFERLAEASPSGVVTAEQILELKVCDPAMGSGAFLVETCRQLGEALVEAWTREDALPEIPDDEDALHHAQRLVAQRCVYGVDKNPMAVDLAKVSLWLLTMARDHPLTFLDHNLRCGDSLVGLNPKQVDVLHWQTGGQLKFVDRDLPKKLARVTATRVKIAQTLDGDERELAGALAEAETLLADLRLAADGVVAAFFRGAKPKEREAQRSKVEEMTRALLGKGEREPLRAYVEAALGGDPPLKPFHWHFEFPEVFDMSRGGFDAIVGNPPFQGGRNLSASLGEIYLKWLTEVYEGSQGGSDLVAFFFRRAFSLLRLGGAFGLIATNTIGQGDTRSTGLRWICTHGGTIYSATKRLKWPGMAAVVVSVVHVSVGPYAGVKRLDGREVETITAFLFHAGGHADPVRLRANAGKSFQGSIVLGMGFTFDDTDKKGVASPLAEMKRLVAANPACREVIFPYIGGEEVNTSPTHAHHRYVINFGERSEAECRRRWPELMAIVEERVKPERIDKDPDKYPRMVNEWWKFWNPRQNLYEAIADLDRVLVVNCGATPHGAFAFLPARMVYANSLAVFPLPGYDTFAVLQSRIHEGWARFFGSSLEDRLRYTPSDCFETYPFPAVEDGRGKMEEGRGDVLERVGREYYQFRADLMVRTGLGMTKTYNRFHDPDEDHPDIGRLRDLHDAMDRAVLRAYGWDDVPTACEFLLDYEDDDETSARRKKPYRYRWPDDVRDEVLARLLALNAERAEQEKALGAHAKTSPRRRTRATDDDDLTLF